MGTEEVRVKIDEEKQKDLFNKFLDQFSKDAEAAKFLGISKYNLSDYKNCRTTYLPVDVLKKVTNYLKINMPEIKEAKTLSEIRKSMASKATIALKNKYGSGWKKVLQKGSRVALEKRYGKDAYKIITKRGHEISRQKFGDNWRKVLSERGIESLKAKYGQKWSSVILLKGRKKLEKKFGNNWSKKLSKLAQESIYKKYVLDFNRRPPIQRNIFEKRKVNISEKKIIEYLKMNNIPFENNVVRNDLEFDILIPDSVNPKYVIEVSDIKPSTYNQRKKIIQLYYQKLFFPNAQHIVILRTSSSGTNNRHTLHKITKSFLDAEKIILLSLDKIDNNIHILIDCIKNNKKIDINENISFEAKTLTNSKKGGITQSRKINDDEIKLRNLLLEIGSTATGAHLIEIKDKSFVCFDNFEIYEGVKIAYEITSGKSYNTLRALAGKILLFKKFNKDVRIIVILLNPNISNNTSFDILKMVADKVILRGSFNKEYLREVRSSLIKS